MIAYLGSKNKSFLLLSLMAFSLFPFKGFGALFYGLTNTGGLAGGGAIISFNPQTNAEAVVWSFGNDSLDGYYPAGNLVFYTPEGLLYGMTTMGGANYNGQAGIIFSFNPETDSETIVWNFGSGTDGRMPYGSLVYYQATGVFYGTTDSGGTNGSGTIFSFNPANDSEKVVYNFGSVAGDGLSPLGNLTYNDSTGLFYGMTCFGGTYDSGVIFSFNPATNAESTLWSFGSGNDGTLPAGSLVVDPNNGLYYGLTGAGGNDQAGAIISFNLNGNAEQTVWNFGNGRDGSFPAGDMIFDSARQIFYGTTEYGGNSTTGTGTIFSFNPSGATENVLWNFGTGTDGQLPAGNLVYNPGNGLYYGMASQGGTDSIGAIFSFNPQTSAESVVYSFNGIFDGSLPLGSLVLYSGPTAIQPLANTYASVNIYPNPASNTFVIDGLTSGQKIELYNDTGQLVSTFTANGSAQQVDISGQADGQYIIQVIKADGAIVARKQVVKAN